MEEISRSLSRLRPPAYQKLLPCSTSYSALRSNEVCTQSLRKLNLLLRRRRRRERLIYSSAALRSISCSLALRCPSRSSRRRQIANAGMEGAVAEPKASSYTYWVRGATADAAPPPVPRKLSADDLSKRPQLATTLGSVWNQAGTWEEKNLSSWASSRIKELLKSLGSLEFSSGKAYIEEVSKCSGEASVVIVRNKKRIGYTYELSFKFKGEWLIGKESKKIKGYLDIPEFSYGELEDLQIEIRLNEENNLSLEDKRRICKDLKLFMKPVRDNLLKFEEELKDK